MTKTKLTPVKGRTVPLEDGTPWPTDKKGNAIDHEVMMSRYYRRRLRDGDLRDDRAEAQLKKDSDNDPTSRKAGK